MISEEEVGPPTGSREKSSETPERPSGGRSIVWRLISSPLVWLLILMCWQFVSLRAPNGMPAKRVNDTNTYLGALDNMTLTDVLGGSRTLGYPLFLKLTGPLSHDLGAVPEAHTFVYFGAIVVFWAAAAAYSGSQWLALAFAAPLVFADLFKIVKRIQPDFLSCALAVAALGFLVWATARPDRRIYLWLLGVFVFLAYQTRPAYLFFLGFVPMMGLVLWICRRGLSWRHLGRWWLAVCIAALVPFILYSTVRWLVVGHFGLVSYGGVNAIGIAAPLLDSEVVDGLPAEVKPYGKRIYRRLRMGQDRVPPYPASLGGAAFRYNRIVWKHCFPLAAEYLEEQSADGTPPDLVDINALLTETSKAIFRLAPGGYLQWITSSVGRTTQRIVRSPWIRFPGIVLALTFAGLGAWWVTSRFRDRGAAAVGTETLATSLGPAVGLLLLGVGYYLCHILLIVAVEIPIPRYVVTTSLFLSGSAVGLVWGLWRQSSIGVFANRTE